jgi:hypothetical protein
LFTEVSPKIDLYLIIYETAHDKLGKIMTKNEIDMIAKGIFNMIGFVNFKMS